MLKNKKLINYYLKPEFLILDIDSSDEISILCSFVTFKNYEVKYQNLKFLIANSRDWAAQEKKIEQLIRY